MFVKTEKPEDYSVVGEIKNRSTKKLSLEEIQKFQYHFQILQEEEANTGQSITSVLVLPPNYSSIFPFF